MNLNYYIIILIYYSIIMSVILYDYELNKLGILIDGTMTFTEIYKILSFNIKKKHHEEGSILCFLNYIKNKLDANNEKTADLLTHLNIQINSINNSIQKTNTTHQYYCKIMETVGVKFDGSMLLDEIIEKINIAKTRQGKPYAESSKLCFMNALQWKLRENGVINKELSESIKQKISIYNKQNSVKDNKFLENQKKNYIEWPGIIEVYKEVEKLKNNSQSDHLNYVILSLYINNDGCVRRVLDFTEMHIIEEVTPEILNDKNYYVRKSKQQIYNIYKTKKQYGTQIFDVPQLLVDILEEYINKYNVKGSLLNMSKDNLKARIKNIFLKYTNKNVGIGIFRHSYISYHIKDNLTSEQKEEIARKFGHSFNMQDIYRKKDIVDTTIIKKNEDLIIKKKGRPKKYNTLDEKKEAHRLAKQQWNLDPIKKQRARDMAKKYYEDPEKAERKRQLERERYQRNKNNIQ